MAAFSVWMRTNAHPRYWLSYRPWKGVTIILGALVPAVLIASRGTPADGKLGALVWAIAFTVTLLWATAYDHEAYMRAQESAA